MPKDRTPDLPLAALEAAVEQALRGVKRFTIAFSGGLGSTLLAALARKRGDPRCIAVGMAGSEDLEAAEQAAKFLDYRVDTVILDSMALLRTAQELAGRFPRIRLAAIPNLVPLAIVRERTDVGIGLAGIAEWSVGEEERGACERMGLRLPWMADGVQRGIHSRSDLEACAALLGIPRRFRETSARAPAEGSGAAAALRSLASAEDRSVEELLAAGRSQ